MRGPLRAVPRGYGALREGLSWGSMGRWTIGGLALACACGPSSADGTQSGSGSDGETTSSDTSLDADHDGSSPGTSESSSASTSTSAETVDTTASDEVDDAPQFDVAAPPVPEVCTASIEQQFDLEVSGPDGDVMVMHGWWGWEACCVLDPWIVLAQPAGIEVIEGSIEGPHLPIYVRGTWDHEGPYVGEQPVAFAPLDGEIAEIEMGFELVEPLDPDASMEDEQPLLSATFDIDAEGWSVHGSVVLPHCAALDTDGCPCE
jgi:hypothetical protein